jgi:integrase
VQKTLKHIVTFDEATERYIAAHESSWRNAKHRQQWRNTLSTYAGPMIGKMPVGDIVMDDVLRVLEPIWETKAETASRVRGRIENVLDWARVRGLRDGINPAAWRGQLAHLLPARNKARSVKHHPALPWRQLPQFMTELRDNTAISAKALAFTILTAMRTTEVIEAKWIEIDIEAGVWTVPKERMKAGREHRVPLPKAAHAVLGALPLVDGNAYVFPGTRKGRPLSNMAMLELVRGLRPGLTVHGFRSTFRDWAAEATNFPRELAEAALAHVLGSATERAYQRGDLFEKRREMMTAWAEFAGRLRKRTSNSIR